MKITLNIPDDKAIFFLELFQKLNLPILHKELEIPEFHKSILDERMSAYLQNPDDLLDWEQVKKELDDQEGL